MSSLIKIFKRSFTTNIISTINVYGNTNFGIYPRAVTWYVPLGHGVKRGEIIASYETCGNVNGIFKCRTFNVVAPGDGVLTKQNMEVYQDFSPTIPLAEISSE